MTDRMNEEERKDSPPAPMVDVSTDALAIVADTGGEFNCALVCINMLYNFIQA